MIETTKAMNIDLNIGIIKYFDTHTVDIQFILSNINYTIIATILYLD